MLLQVLIVPLLAGLSGRGVKPLTWASCFIALVGVGLLEQGGAPPGIGDIWNLLSALFFGLQVCRVLSWLHHLVATICRLEYEPGLFCCVLSWLNLPPYC